MRQSWSAHANWWPARGRLCRPPRSQTDHDRDERCQWADQPFDILPYALLWIITFSYLILFLLLRSLFLPLKAILMNILSFLLMNLAFDFKFSSIVITYHAEEVCEIEFINYLIENSVNENVYTVVKYLFEYQ